MTLGDYELHAIDTGRFGLDGGAMFGVVPKPLWSRSNPPDDRNRIELAARALLLVGRGKTILVDNGNGSKFTDKQIDIYRLDTSLFDLTRSLAVHGVAPQDITDVILTHLHFDHAGGSTVRIDGELTPAFPRARYYVQRSQWNQAVNPTEKDRGSFMPDDFLPLMEHGVLELLDGEGELFPGISLLIVNGHTSGLQLPLITGGSATVLYCCDLFPTISHVPLPYIMAYDLRPMVTLEEKKKLLPRAFEEGWTLFFEHDPAVTAGKLKKTDKGFAFGKAVPFG